MMNYRQPVITEISFELEIDQARDLIAKDRTLMGRRSTSDPYIVIFLQQHRLGKTKVVSKTCSPVWKESFPIRLDSSMIKILKERPLELRIFDHDDLGGDDFMGLIMLSFSEIIEATSAAAASAAQAGSGGGTSQWKKVEKTRPGSTLRCMNAKGDVCLAFSPLQGRRVLDVPVGNTLPLHHLHITVGLAWDLEPSHGPGGRIDLDSSCVAVDHEGKVRLEDSVYYGNLTNPTRSLVHSGDETTGEGAGDDEQIQIQLDRLPHHIIALYVILTCAGPTPKTLSDVRSAQVRFFASETQEVICRFVPAEMGNNTALFLVRIVRDPNHGWQLTPISEGNSYARDFGTLIPQIKSYTQDVIPNMPPIDPEERVAIMRKGGTIRVADYVAGHVVPESLTMGLAWDVTDGVNIDLDASAVLLDADLQLVDTVWFRQLTSHDGSIHHSGDEREGDANGDDEKIEVKLNQVSSNVRYIGFVVNSYSGQELDDVNQASCHLFNSSTTADVAKYTLSNAKNLNGFTAMIMACLYRDKGAEMGWNLAIVSEPANGRTVKDNVDELQSFLQRRPPQTPEALPAEDDIDLSVMPASIPLSNEDEIIVLPDGEVKKYI